MSSAYGLQPAPPSAHSGCLSFSDYQQDYTVNACPIPLSLSQPPSIPSPTGVTFPSSYISYGPVCTSLVALPFAVQLFGNPYSNVSFCTSGTLLFGPTPPAGYSAVLASSPNQPLPSTFYAGVGPAVEPLQAYLVFNTNVNSAVSYGTVGLPPNRQFIARYQNMAFYSADPAIPPVVSFDVVFSENAPSLVQFVYYRFDAPIPGYSASMSVGLQDSNLNHFMAVYNSYTNWTDVRQALLGNILSFNYSGSSYAYGLQPAPPSAHSGCLSFSDYQQDYTVNACPIPLSLSQPPSIPSPTGVTFPSSYISYGPVCTSLVALPFAVQLFGNPYSNVSFCTSGTLLFGPTPPAGYSAVLASSPNQPLPSTFYAGVGPAVEPLQAYLVFNTNVNSAVSYGTVGLPPNRQFIARYQNMAFYSADPAIPPVVSFDVVFSENAPSLVQFVYYRFDAPIPGYSASMSVGLQDSNLNHFMAVYNSYTNWTDVRQALLGNILSFNYSGSSYAYGLQPAPPSAHSGCLSFSDYQQDYTVNACPIPLSLSQPPSIPSPTGVTFPSSYISYGPVCTSLVALPFAVQLFGNPYSNVSFCTSGTLLFGPTPPAGYSAVLASSPNQPLPSTFYAGVGPAVEPLQAYLVFNTNVNSAVSYGTVGLPPNRQFIARYQNMAFYSADPAIPPVVSFDVVFSENAPSLVQFVYYRFDAPIPGYSASMSVGLQDSNLNHFMAVYNSYTNWTDVRQALLGNILSFNYSGSSYAYGLQPAPPSAHSGCLSFSDYQQDYTVNACPIPLSLSQPPSIPSPTGVTFPSSYISYGPVCTSLVALPFAVQLFGNPYSNVSFCTSGTLLFGPTPPAGYSAVLASSPNQPLPSTFYAGVGPAVEPLQAYLVFNTNVNSAVSYGTVGLPPNRQFIARYQNMAFYSADPAIPPVVSFDVVFSENAPSLVQFVYYRFDAPIPGYSASMSVGLQDSNLNHFMAVYNSYTNWTDVRQALLGNILSFNYSGSSYAYGLQPAPPSAHSGCLSFSDYQQDYTVNACPIPLSLSQPPSIPSPTGVTFPSSYISYGPVCTSLVALPFAVQLFGNPYSNVSFCTSGTLLFGPTPPAGYSAVLASSPNQPLPSTFYAGVGPAVEPLQAYLVFNTNVNSAVSYGTVGLPPNRQFIARYQNMAFYSADPAIPPVVSFDVVFSENAPSLVQFVYYRFDAPIPGYSASMSVGLQDSNLNHFMAVYNSYTNWTDVRQALLGNILSFNYSGSSYAYGLQPAPPSAHSGCLSFSDYQQDYTVNACPIPLSLSQPPSIPSPTGVTFPSSYISYGPVCTSLVALPFAVQLFGNPYSNVSFCTSGTLLFGPTPPAGYSAVLASSPNQPLPSTFYAGVGPAVEPLQAYLVFNTNVNSAVSYGTVGLPPNRQFIARYQNMAFYSADPAIPPVVSFDVVFSENAPSLVQFVYYRFDAPIPGYSASMSVGLQDSNLNHFMAVYNSYTNWTDVRQALLGNILSFNYSGSSYAYGLQPAPPSAHSGCLSFSDYQQDYTVNACPIPLSLSQPPSIPSPTGVTFPSSYISYGPVCTSLVALPFAVQLFGNPYSNVSFCTSGTLLFGPTPPAGYSAVLASSPNQPLPSTFYAGVGPAVEPLQAYLVFNTNVNSAVSYGTVGLPPNRQFIARYQNMAFYSADPAIPPVVSFDVVFSENAPSLVQFVYYRFDAPIPGYSASMSVGLQDSNLNHFMAVYNSYTNWTDVRQALLGNILSFSRANLAVSSSSAVSAIGSSSSPLTVSSIGGGISGHGSSSSFSSISGYTSSPALTSAVASGHLCVLLYSLPGNIEYPWSAAINVQFQYNTTVTLTPAGSAVRILNGTGSRTFTNRFGASFTTPLLLTSPDNNQTDNWLYLASPLPLDNRGLTWNLSVPIQLPGQGPSVLSPVIHLYNESGVIAEGGSSLVDGLGSAFYSDVAGFNNVTIGAININTLAVDYNSCQAPITNTNGIRPEMQPSASNGALRFSYSYFISDGLTYSVQGNLVVSTTSAFANSKDQLSNHYQTISDVTGARIYTFLATGARLASNILGLAPAGSSLASQRFYPYTFLTSAPGIYTINTAPFFDGSGVEFIVSPAIPANGSPPGANTQYNTTTLSVIPTANVGAVLSDGVYITAPQQNLQMQSYTFL